MKLITVVNLRQAIGVILNLYVKQPPLTVPIAATTILNAPKKKKREKEIVTITNHALHQIVQSGNFYKSSVSVAYIDERKKTATKRLLYIYIYIYIYENLLFISRPSSP